MAPNLSVNEYSQSLCLRQMSVTLETSAGPLKVVLFWREAPEACLNFLALAGQGSLAGRNAHNRGSVLYFKIPRDSIAPIPHLEVSPDIRHLPGSLGLEKPHRSSFYLLLDAAPELDDTHTVFGRVVAGDFRGLREKPITITDVIIHANPFAAQ